MYRRNLGAHDGRFSMEKQIRNIAIIAHVDHGKTTLVDGLLKQSRTFHDKAEELKQEFIMDSNELERERGITILAKNTAIKYKGTKINIIDTPGHADFAGEVERTLHMADGCLLIVDAKEGPMPQTRFVLQKALALGLKVIVVINKIDKKDQRAADVLEETTNLFLDLAKADDQLDFPVIYAIGRAGIAFNAMPEGNLENLEGTLEPLFEKIIEYVPAPKNSDEGGFQLLVTALDWDTFRGKYSLGRVHRGIAKAGLAVQLLHPDGKKESGRIEKVFVNEGLKRVEVPEAFAGDIIALTGFPNSHISTTIADAASPEALPLIAVEDPTLKITMGPNTSPFVGKDGKKVTSREIDERLTRELETNVSLRVEPLDGGSFLLSGRGELHLSVLIETMRREGFEMQVSKPEVIMKEIDGARMEPMEELVVDVPEEYSGTVTAELQKRRSEMQNMSPHSGGLRFTYNIPTKNLLGLRNVLLTKTKGTAVLNSVFLKYAPESVSLPRTRNGVLISAEAGVSVTYGLEVAQGRGATFIPPQTEVYEGMVIGQNSREEDLEINVCKEKKLSNVRASFNDMAIQLSPPIVMSLEQALDFLESDELLEVTPNHLRLRKRYLTRGERDKNSKHK
jgi:GTP-binding protein